MEQYKADFIDFLVQRGIGLGEDRSLKSKRLSPYFIDLRALNDGDLVSRLGAAYADAIHDSNIEFDSVYGLPEAGVGLVVATSIALAAKGKNKPWFFTRKLPKDYGETTGLSIDDRRKLYVGRAPSDGERILPLDDVLTTGDTKYEAIEALNKLANGLRYPALVIAVDRQEVGIDGKSAIHEFTERTGIPVISIVNASELYKRLKERPDLNEDHVERIARYLRVYGSEQTREEFGGSLNQKVIVRNRSIIPACDVSTIEEFEELVIETADIDGIGGYKVGFELGLGYGLSQVVDIARGHTSKPIVYDHQKAGTDIPDTGKNFARVCKKAGVNAVILFPQAGPETERAWIYHALDNGLKVIVGGIMTHSAYSVSEGGFITDEGAIEMYRIAARAGVNNFVVPGNKPDVIKTIRDCIEEQGISPTLFATGFIAQGGAISEAGHAAGNSWHAIVGTEIYKAPDKRKAAEELTKQI